MLRINWIEFVWHLLRKVDLHKEKNTLYILVNEGYNFMMNYLVY